MLVSTYEQTQGLCSTVQAGTMRDMRGDMAGSCFYLGRSAFMTAGHVVRSLAEGDGEPSVLVARAGTNRNHALVIRDSEILQSDIGLVRVSATERELAGLCHPMYWSLTDLHALDEVRAFGYAHGLHRVDDRLATIQRAFRGYVVSVPYEYKPAAFEGPPFLAYELSFAAPRGLSGAPLQSLAPPLIVYGMIIGNSQIRMTVFDSEERVTAGERVKRVEYFEALTLGVAVRPESILDQRSTLLSATVREHLDSLGLLRQPPYS